MSELSGLNQGYSYHYHKARTEFIDWFYRYHTDGRMKTLRSVVVDDEDMIEFDDELKYALESFEECEQVKIVYEYSGIGHCLKIKWEHSPWWVGQVMHFYYCVMLPIDDVNLVEPAKLSRREEE